LGDLLAQGLGFGVWHGLSQMISFENMKLGCWLAHAPFKRTQVCFADDEWMCINRLE
jgi:hypothetical protein